MFNNKGEEEAKPDSVDHNQIMHHNNEEENESAMQEQPIQHFVECPHCSHQNISGESKCEKCYGQLPVISPNSTILLVQCHNDEEDEKNCSYCHGNRTVNDPDTGDKNIVHTDQKYHKFGLNSSKLTVDDLELLLDNGFTRCGNYIYNRTNQSSCCEVWQYRVDISEFKISQS